MYFIFCAVADPWVDGVNLDTEKHTQINSSIKASSIGSSIVKAAEKSHNHSTEGCGDGCPQHTCHFGHCGTLFADSTVGFDHTVEQTLYGEYSSFIPDAPTLGFKKPPKHLA